MDRVPSGNEEQFQMLLMALEDLDSGICLFQSEEQSKWAAFIQKELKCKKVIAHNIAEDDEKAGMPLISDFKRWAAQEEADVIIVYNLQLLGLRFGDRKAVEHLNFMRDQIQNIGKLFLFGASSYFDMLLSRGARDLYSCIRYHFKFVKPASEEGISERVDERELGGDYALEMEKYREYKKRAQEKEGEERVPFCLECMGSWQRVRGNLPLSERDDIRQMAEQTDAYYREKEITLSDMEQIWTLADTWLELEEWERGMHWYSLTEDRIRQELGAGNRMYADVLVRLGDYYSLTSDYERSEQYYDQAIRVYEESNAPLEQIYENVWMKRAVLYRRKCQYEQALEIYEKLMQYFTAKYGSGYVENAVCLNNEGRVYEELGNASEALSKYQEALSLLLASGEMNHLLCALYNNISALYLDNGDLDNAWKNLRQAKRATESIYGNDSAIMGRIYNLMSGIWKRRGRIDKAEECLKKAMELTVKTHTTETEQAAHIYHNMGNILMQKNDPFRAIPLYHRALLLRLKIYGEKNHLAARSYAELGCAFAGIKDKKQSRENIAKAMEIYTALYGKDCPMVSELEHLLNPAPVR